MDIEQVIRRWSAGEAIRAIGRATGMDRNTVRRIIRLGEEVGLKVGDTADEEQRRRIREGLGRPGAPPAPTRAEQILDPYRERIRNWLSQERLLLTKILELLLREGVVVTYSMLYRYASKHCGFQTTTVTVRRAEVEPGEVAEVDFGELGLFQELGSNQRRRLWVFVVTLGHSRLNCVVPTFRQDLASVIDCFEQAFEFFGGCPRRVVIDNIKACVEKADPYTPRFNKTFLEYANHRGFVVDPARPNHPKDKPIVENTVRYVRERFWKGETFTDLEDIRRRAVIWCRDVAGRRIHGTTREAPMEVFESRERSKLIPLSGERYDPPQWGIV